MRIKVSLTFILFFLLNIAGVGQYIGGSGDGHSFSKLTNITCTPTNVNPYIGGSGDGHSFSKLTNITCTPTNVNPYIGGLGDGHSFSKLTNTVCSVTNVNPFIGGLGDGHSFSNLTNLTCVVVNVNPFIGGIADGHSYGTITNITCTVTNINPFIGGIADGHGNNSIYHVSPSACQSIVLPVELVSFNAIPDSTKVHVSWVTASEVNSDYFEVQKTKDGNSYNSVALVKAAGNSIYTKYYNAYDLYPYMGTSYYRLKQVDLDGSSKYTNDVPVKFNDSPFSVFPNPSRRGDILTITYNSKYGSDLVSFQINDLIGKHIITRTYTAAMGMNSFTLQLPDISSGIYMAEFTTTYFHQIIKLVVSN